MWPVMPLSLGCGRIECVKAGPCRDCGGGWLLSFVFVLVTGSTRVCPGMLCSGRVCCCDVVETSYEGHMVDALASRADEGRWSLR